jgi:hypothetical protein
MERIKNMVSMFEITKDMFKAKSDFDKELEYKKWLDTIQKAEENAMEQVLKKIDELAKKSLEESIKNDFSKKEAPEQYAWNYLDLPLRVYLCWGKLTLYSVDYEDEIVYELHVSTDVNTGKLSIQYAGEDGSFLSHKKILKSIKLENGMNNGN